MFCVGATVAMWWAAYRFYRHPRPEGGERSSGPRWGEKEIVAQYNGPCTSCDVRVLPGDAAYWHTEDRTVRHVDCEAARARREARKATEQREKDAAAFSKLLDRLATAKGAATRRNVVERAEALNLTPQQRLQLLLEAGRLDTDATLEKVEGLKSKAVKRRHLEEALAAIRADAVPDEMQAEQVALLEEALKTLDSE